MPCWIPHSRGRSLCQPLDVDQTGKCYTGMILGVDTSVADAQLRHHQTEGPPKHVTVEKIENSEFCTSTGVPPRPLHRTLVGAKAFSSERNLAMAGGMNASCAAPKIMERSLLKSKWPKRTSERSCPCAGRPAFPKSRTSSVCANLN